MIEVGVDMPTSPSENEGSIKIKRDKRKQKKKTQENILGDRNFFLRKNCDFLPF